MIILYVDKTVRGYRYGRGNIIQLAPIEEALLVERGEAEVFSVSPDLSALLEKIRNLSDLPDPAAARESLGLGALALLDAATYTTVNGAIRTVEARLLENLSVRDLGAVGDGVTDDYPAFQAAHDLLSGPTSYRGGRIRVPFGTYYLSDTWKISKRVTIVGDNSGDQPNTAGTLLNFPADKTGIRLYSNIDSITGTGADRTQIEGLNLTALARNESGKGIHATCVVKIDHCIVRGFEEHGIHMHGQTGVGATGIADGWSVKNTRILVCGGNGLHVNGNDANVGYAEGVECSSNEGFGYYDNASYCNTYVACMSHFNGLGSFYNRNGTGLGGVYVGCYTEHAGLCDFDANVLVLGGVMTFDTGTGVVPSPLGLMLTSHPNRPIVFARGGVEVGRIDGTTNKFTGFAGARWQTVSTDWTDMMPGRIDMVTSVAASQGRLYFTNPNGQVGSITTGGTATAYNTSSDVRMKQNIVDAPDAGADIDAVRVVSFNWKQTGELQKYGVVAQELVEVFPDAVAVGDDAEEITENVWGVDYSKLVPMLVKEVQDLRARVKVLEG